MNQGGEPGHDDYGLPRVDIKVPDDARELHRDVQAYYRELRAQRRHDRSVRWRAPLQRTGLATPLIAGCLILAMVAGMALTMVTASRYFSRISGPPSTRAMSRTPGSSMMRPGAGHGQAPGAHSASLPGSGTPGRTVPGQTAPGQAPPAQATRGRGAPAQPADLRLPDKTILVAGRSVALRTLTSAALLMVPASCQCARTVGRLMSQAKPAGITVYLVGRPGSVRQLMALAHASGAGSAQLAVDNDGALRSAYHRAGLTLLLVDSQGTVAVVPRLHASFQLPAMAAS